MTRKSVVAGVVVIVCAVGATWFMKKRSAAAPDESDQPTATVVTVKTEELKRATLRGFVEGYGTVTPAPASGAQAPASARVASAVAGVVAKTLVAEGDSVKMGDPLFELDSRVAKIALERARRAATYARESAARQQKLFAEQNTSKRNLQDAEAQAAAAEADLAAAQTQLDWAHITAPLAGVVTHVNVRPGEAVDLTTVLAEVTDLSRLVVSADIPAAEAAGLKVGEVVEILTDPPVKAVLSFASPSVDPSNDTVAIRAELAKGSALRPGQFVPLRIVTSEHPDVLVAPVASVITDDDGHSVVAVVTGNEAVQTPVVPGLREDGLVEITGKGLTAGQSVVTVGAYGLPEKTRVNVDGAPASPPVTPP